ncbi:YjbH domain-containing protein [Tateyamaria armeniaca]|uniref:YjbH domain-containing protein n=1 Tax=Tateyamaria armeniaca TaxID=2518930 RepID=A0ABW8UZ03_9RHOB
MPRLYGSFRYGAIREFSGRAENNGDLFDRSFDIHYQLAFETDRRPALAFGLRDFGGTGVLSGEYFVATKTFGDRLTVTGGMGWGRLAQRGSFRNPLAEFAGRFENRPNANEGGINTTGQLDFGAWFRGPRRPFRRGWNTVRPTV